MPPQTLTATTNTWRLTQKSNSTRLLANLKRVGGEGVEEITAEEVESRKNRRTKSVRAPTRMTFTALQSTQKVSTTSMQVWRTTLQVALCRTKWVFWRTKMSNHLTKTNFCCKSRAICTKNWKHSAEVNVSSPALISKRQLRSKKKTSKRNLKRMIRVRRRRGLRRWQWKRPEITTHTWLAILVVHHKRDPSPLKTTTPNSTTVHRCWPRGCKAVWMCSKIRLTSEMEEIVDFRVQQTNRPRLLNLAAEAH